MTTKKTFCNVDWHLLDVDSNSGEVSAEQDVFEAALVALGGADLKRFRQLDFGTCHDSCFRRRQLVAGGIRQLRQLDGTSIINLE